MSNPARPSENFTLYKDNTGAFSFTLVRGENPIDIVNEYLTLRVVFYNRTGGIETGEFLFDYDLADLTLTNTNTVSAIITKERVNQLFGRGLCFVELVITTASKTESLYVNQVQVFANIQGAEKSNDATLDVDNEFNVTIDVTTLVIPTIPDSVINPNNISQSVNGKGVSDYLKTIEGERFLLTGANTLSTRYLGDWVENAGAVAEYSESEGAITVTINDTGYQGLKLEPELSPFKINTDYYFEVEMRLVSGQSVPIRIGYFGAENVGNTVITPTSEWQTFKFKVNSSVLTFGYFIIAPNSVFNSVIAIRKVLASEQTNYEVILDDRVKRLESDDLSTFDLEEELTKSDIVNLPIGTITINETIDIPSGKTIIGVRGKTIIQAGSDVIDVLRLNGVNDITLKDFTIKGLFPNTTLGAPLSTPIAGTVDSVNDAITEAGVGTKSGIIINNVKRVNISGLEVSNFDAYGIKVTQTGKSYDYGINVFENYFHDSYCNLKLDSEAEYSSYTGNVFSLSQFGLIVNSGNNLFTNNKINKNRVGLVMNAGVNNSHGSFSACTFNHNSLYGILLDALEFGEVFSACQHWYGDVYVRNSKGIVFNGCQFGRSDVFADGNFTGGGAWMITNCPIMQGVEINEDYLGNTSNLLLKNNFKADGTDSSAFNN
jgi:hypothetical protein